MARREDPSPTVTIAGQTFAIRQSGSACGAADVSSQVIVNRKALLEGFSDIQYTQQLTLTNQGPDVPGPLYVALEGLCLGGPSSCPLAEPFQVTTCDGMLSPMILVSPSGLASGQSLNHDMQFYGPPYVPLVAGGQVNSVFLTVFSGTPSQ